VNVTSTYSANLYDISRRKPSRRTTNLKEPKAPKMKIRLCPGWNSQRGPFYIYIYQYI